MRVGVWVLRARELTPTHPGEGGHVESDQTKHALAVRLMAWAGGFSGRPGAADAGRVAASRSRRP